jgi:sulfur transfer complex TusBCD TusB component (DsrH family)
LNFFRENNSKNLSRNTGKCADNLLKTDTIKAFQDAVLAIIGNYRYYLYYDEIKQVYKVNDDLYYHSKRRKANSVSQNDFYYQFRNTQAFQEVDKRLKR